MRKVIGIGETILDIIFRGDQPSAAVPGGSVFNGIVSLGRKGVNVGFISETGYDSEGNMLFAFGDKGRQLGNLQNPSAITYSGSDLYVLDSSMNSVTVYKRTEYGDVIDQALYHSNTREYSKALEDWNEILKRNNN